ncbi:MAG: FAD-dependent oxidoreductase [Verrucomicrobiae bacterium]|nr:FAD-dependent oxidoreductase [Verrucomicrobiae bacterium]
MNPDVDIAVVGAGASGLAAAVSAARTGAQTLLLDARPAPGGTGGFSGLTTLCGLYDEDGKFLNDGFVREFAEALAETNEAAPARASSTRDLATPHPGVSQRQGRVWVLPYRPTRFRELASQLTTNTPNLRAEWNRSVTEVVCAGNRITQLNGVRVGAVIDCSGVAAVAQAVGAETLATDARTQAAAIIFPLKKVRRVFSSVADMAQVLLPLARARFPALHLQPGFAPGEFTAKFAGSAEQVPALLAFLRANVPGFEPCETVPAEITVTARAGRMIIGAYVLTGADVLGGRKFADAAARGAWPIEQWPEGQAARFRYLPPHTHYEIPRRCLRAARFENLFMAGKCLSADADAIASARVMGLGLATGAAAGVLAVDSLTSTRFK